MTRNPALTHRLVAPTVLAVAVLAASDDRSASIPDPRSKTSGVSPAAVPSGLSGSPGSPGAPVLSKKERAERIRLLPDDAKRWLEEIARPIILPEEENLFLLLTQEHEREIFREEFWKRREKAGLLHPLGPGYRTRYLELLHLADTVYDGRLEDAGRMVIAHGEPASLNELPGCGDTFRDLEVWTYRGTARSNIAGKTYLFYRHTPGMPRRLWDVSIPDSDLFQPGSCVKRFADLTSECTRTKQDPHRNPCLYTPLCQEVCGVFQTWLHIRERQGSASGGHKESTEALMAPAVEPEGLDGLAARFPSIQNPAAKVIGAEAAKVSPAEPTPIPTVSMSPEEIRERILKLEPKYREFLDLAGPMFIGDELCRFLLMSDSSRDTFIREFWRRRK